MTIDAYIFDAVRTPRGKGKKDGSLYQTKPVDLLAKMFSAIEQRNELDTSIIDDVVIGCASPVGEQGANIAKTAALVAGWDFSVPGIQLSRFCGSGLDAVNLAAMKVKSGEESMVVAGGVESMSHTPMGSNPNPWFMDPQTNIKSRYLPQGISADLIATISEISREDADAFALRSHQRALNAQECGYFNNSIIPVFDMNNNLVLAKDETIRADANLESLSQLKAAFAQMGSFGLDDSAISFYPEVEKINHIHSAGNSSGIVDGAAAVLIGSLNAGKALNLTPRAKILSTAVIGCEPALMLTGPAPATLKALKKANLTVDDIDLFEVNEAFASVVLHFQKELNIPADKINVNGGAIALGHPLGATGAMLVGTIIDELERQQLKYGVVTLCIAEGMGIATVIERVELSGIQENT